MREAYPNKSETFVDETPTELVTRTLVLIIAGFMKLE